MTAEVAPLASPTMTLRRLLAIGLTLATAGSAGAQGTIYRWTDDRGVVHFSDTPPRNQRNVETKVMPPAPPRAPAPGAAEAAAEAAPADGTPAAAAATPARVEIIAQQSDPTGESTQVIYGRVRNRGGQPARNVEVSVRVVSPAQGDECLTETLDVRPSTLEPDAEGEFEVSLTHPCFRGETRIELQVDWQ